MGLTTSPASFKESGVPASRVLSREWLKFEGDMISGLFAQTESALARRWRSRHENSYHKSDGRSGRRNAFPWGRLVPSFGSRGADPHSRFRRGTPGSGTRRRAWTGPYERPRLAEAGVQAANQDPNRA